MGAHQSSRFPHGGDPSARLPPAHNPRLARAEERRRSAQTRLADAITGFAGSMAFVYIHVLWFGCWIGFGVERYPYGLLTMIVSLEAIFVLISQNRADARRQVMTDQQWATVQVEEEQNERLLALSEQMLGLIEEVRGFTDVAQEDHGQSAELFALCRRTLALTEEAHVSGAAGGRRAEAAVTAARCAGSESPASCDASSPRQTRR